MRKLYYVSIILIIVHNVTCKPCTDVQRVDITGGIEFGNGSIIYKNVEYVLNTWYEEIVDGIVLRYGCPCIGYTCLWKCCGEGNAFFGRNCNETDDPSLHPFSPSLYKGKDPIELSADEHFFFMYAIPCSERYLLDSNSRNVEMYIQQVFIFKVIYSVNSY